MTDIQPQIENDEISLKELIQKTKEWTAYLKTQWKLILGIAAFGAIVGFAYASFQNPNYIATTTFVLEEDKGGAMSGALGLASSFGFEIGGSGGGLFTSSNIIELMKSRLVVEKTLLNPVPYLNNNKVEKISLAEYYIRANELRDKWSKKSLLSNIQFPPNAERSKFTILQDSILQIISASIIKKNLTIVQKDKKVSIISIDVKTKNQLFSKLFCEQLAKVTSDFYIETKSKKARINVDILQHQADSIRAELNSAIIGVAAATDNVYNLNPAFNVKSTPSKRKQVDVQANTAILTQLVAQLELAKVNLRKETPLIQLIDQPILPLKVQKLNIYLVFLVSFIISLILVSAVLILNSMFRNY